MKNKRILAIMMALVLILTSSFYIVYAEEENVSGEESSQEKEDKEEKEEKEDKEEKEEKEEREEDHSSDESSSDSSGSTDSSSDQQDQGDASSNDQEQELPAVDDGQPEKSSDSGSKAADQEVPAQEVVEPAPADAQVPAADDPSIEVVQEEVQVDEVPSFDTETVEPELPVIIKYVETDAYPEGTILREYQDFDELGNPVIVREIATPPIVEVTADEEINLLDHFGLVASSAPVPNFDNGGWPGIPASYEYNWDNTDNATKYGMWGGNGNLQGYVASTIEDVNVRHRMQMYCDGDNIHLLITYASCFDNPGNGDDYNFYLDGEHVKFKVVYDDNGANLTSGRSPGTYNLKVLHEDRSGSSYEALGSYGTMTVHEGQLNNVTEITIPVSEMVRQNPNINPESFSLIEFFTPNLMYRRMATAGASSGPWPFALGSLVFFTGACCVNERRKYVRDTKSL